MTTSKHRVPLCDHPFPTRNPTDSHHLGTSPQTIRETATSERPSEFESAGQNAAVAAPVIPNPRALMVLGRGRSKRAAPSPAQAAQQQQQQQQQQQRGRPPPPPTLVRRVATRATARISVWTGLPADATRLLLLATLVRLALIAWGEVQDRLSPDVKYTDTDYGVFTDAARSIWRGDGDPSAAVGGAPGERRGWMRGTPFARATYRYSPLLAYAVQGCACNARCNTQNDQDGRAEIYDIGCPTKNCYEIPCMSMACALIHAEPISAFVFVFGGRSSETSRLRHQ